MPSNVGILLLKITVFHFVTFTQFFLAPNKVEVGRYLAKKMWSFFIHAKFLPLNPNFRHSRHFNRMTYNSSNGKMYPVSKWDCSRERIESP